MKNCILLLLCLQCVSMTFGQDGFKLIRKAEKLVKKEKHNRAMKLLQQADSADYGFCGNAWWDARIRIGELKAIIYDKKHDFYSCVKIINTSIHFHSVTDSLKMVYLIRLAGKENIKKELDEYIDNSQHEIQSIIDMPEIEFSFFDEPYYFTSPLLIDEIFSLKRQNHSNDEAFRIAFKNQPFYKLLE